LKRLEDGVYEVIRKTAELEIGKDYIHVRGNWLVISRVGGSGDYGFTDGGEIFLTSLRRSKPKNWIEATKEEVISFFEKHLIQRYGEDWERVKVKECMYRNDEYTNEGLNSVDIA